MALIANAESVLRRKIFKTSSSSGSLKQIQSCIWAFWSLANVDQSLPHKFWQYHQYPLSVRISTSMAFRCIFPNFPNPSHSNPEYEAEAFEAVSVWLAWDRAGDYQFLATVVGALWTNTHRGKWDILSTQEIVTYVLVSKITCFCYFVALSPFFLRENSVWHGV